MNSRGNFYKIDFILHIKTFYKLLPFYVKETKNITGKLKAGNKFPLKNDSALSMAINDE